MNDVLTRCGRAVALAALIGASAAPALATDWSTLKSSDWNGGADAAATEGSSGGEAVAAADPSAGTDWSAEISSAFQGLGMDQARAECYGEVVTGNLSADDQEEAASIVRNAADGQQVRSDVMNAGTDMVGAFSAADGACPEGMSG